MSKYFITDGFKLADAKAYSVITEDKSSTTLFGNFMKVEFVPVGEGYKASFTTVGAIASEGGRCYVRMADADISADVMTINNDGSKVDIEIPVLTGDVFIHIQSNTVQ